MLNMANMSNESRLVRSSNVCLYFFADEVHVQDFLSHLNVESGGHENEWYIYFSYSDALAVAFDSADKIISDSIEFFYKLRRCCDDITFQVHYYEVDEGVTSINLPLRLVDSLSFLRIEVEFSAHEREIKSRWKKH